MEKIKGVGDLLGPGPHRASRNMKKTLQQRKTVPMPRTLQTGIPFQGPLIRRASCMSLVMIVTRLAWMAQRLL
jgi:hypothetical protein